MFCSENYLKNRSSFAQVTFTPFKKEKKKQITINNKLRKNYPNYELIINYFQIGGIGFKTMFEFCCSSPAAACLHVVCLGEFAEYDKHDDDTLFNW